MSAADLELIAGGVSLALSLMIFSYLLGDNFLYRIAVHILVGGTAGFVTVVAVRYVILPWLQLTIGAEGGEANPAFRALGIVPFLIALNLFFKGSPRLSYVGNIGLAFIIGVGTGVALVGAIIGTLIPLVEDAGLVFEEENVLNALIMTLGTIGTLVYFQYLGKRRPDGTVSRTRPMRFLAGIGQGMVAITFGAIYAGAVLTSLNIFSGVIAEQLHFLLER